MKLEDKIIRGIANKYGKDPRVVREIVYHPLLFTKRRMEDPLEDRPVRIRYFGAFVQKNIKNKKFLMSKKKEVLLKNVDELFVAMMSTGRHDDVSKDDILDMLNLNEEEGGPLIVDDLWGIWKEYLK